METKYNPKPRIAVLFGGLSPEHGVSLQSAAAVLGAIDSAQYEVIKIGITRAGEWLLYGGAIEDIENDTWHTSGRCRRVALSPSRKTHGLLVLEENSYREIPLDAAFPVLHGSFGEDGTLQGLLELAGIPIVGCGAEASMLCMDKALAHAVANAAGVAVPRGFVLQRGENVSVLLAQAERLAWPLFVKPARAGSSFGVACAHTTKELGAAVKDAFIYDNKILVEEKANGFEVGCAVMESENGLITGMVDEIELAGDVFDFHEKYTLQSAHIHLPARVNAAKASGIQQTAKKLYTALGCSGFARVDMFLASDGSIVFNEVNTIPGFTPHSRFPGMMRGAGFSFEQLVDTLLERTVTACPPQNSKPTGTSA